MEKSSCVMQGYTDIHCHILPGVDDGSRNIEESMGMLRIAYENQIRRIIVTPHNKPMHYNADQDKIKELITELAARMKQEDITILLYPGNELYYCNELVEKLEAQKACTMAESSYVLVEFAPVDSWEYIRNGINNLIMGGYIPILAHVERYKEMCASTERIEELIEINIKELQEIIDGIGKEQHPYTVFTLGRICYQKNPTLFNSIAERLPDVKFIWIGDGELRDELKSSNIEITGWTDRTTAIKCAMNADVFLLTSRWEGLSISLLESMYIRKICVELCS